MGHLFCYALLIKGECGTGSAVTELENSMSPYSTQDDLLMRSSRKSVFRKGVLEGRMRNWNGGQSMKGYVTSLGYMGWTGNGYMLFASECEYREYMEE